MKLNDTWPLRITAVLWAAWINALVFAILWNIWHDASEEFELDLMRTLATIFLWLVVATFAVVMASRRDKEDSDVG